MLFFLSFFSRERCNSFIPASCGNLWFFSFSITWTVIWQFCNINKTIHYRKAAVDNELPDENLLAPSSNYAYEVAISYRSKETTRPKIQHPSGEVTKLMPAGAADAHRHLELSEHVQCTGSAPILALTTSTSQLQDGVFPFMQHCQVKIKRDRQKIISTGDLIHNAQKTPCLTWWSPPYKTKQ